MQVALDVMRKGWVTINGEEKLGDEDGESGETASGLIDKVFASQWLRCYWALGMHKELLVVRAWQ